MSKVVRGLDVKALYAAEVASISFKDVTEAQWEFLDEKRKTGKDTTPDPMLTLLNEDVHL